MILAWLRDLVSDRRHSGDVMKKRISTEGADRDYSESQSDPASKSAAAGTASCCGTFGQVGGDTRFVRSRLALYGELLRRLQIAWNTLRVPA